MATENLSRIAADFETQLSAAISIGGTSFTLQSVTDADGNSLSDGIYCFTIDRNNTDAKEYLIGQLTASTKTVASISSISRQGVAAANAARAHRIGANVIISDHSILSAIARIFSGQGTINPSAPLAYTSAPTLSDSNQLATKGYVDSVVSGGTVNSNKIIIASQTAGETIAANDLIYFKASDQRWYKADADNTDWSLRQLGIAQGSGTSGNAIANGVLIYGKADGFTGLTAGSLYYLSNTAGGVSATAGTNTLQIGNAEDADTIFFNPNTYVVQNVPSSFIASTAGAADAGKGIKTDAAGVLDPSFLPIDFGDGSDGDVTISAPTTLARDMYYDNLTVTSTLTTDGFRIFVKGTLSGAGTIDWGAANNGGNAVVNTSVGTAGAQSGTGPLKNTAGVATGSTSSNQGGNGGTAGNAGSVGLAGGDGGSGGAGGSAGTLANNSMIHAIKIASLARMGINLKTDLTFETFKQAGSGSGGNGGGGSSGTAGLGGGSGATGGTLVIFAKVWAGTFTIKAVGGNGGNGCGPSSNRGGGGGGSAGNGGIAIIVYSSKTWSGSYNLAGGTAGTGASGSAGAGSNGSNGTTGSSYEIKATATI